MIKRQNIHLYINRDVTLEIHLAADTPDLTGATLTWRLGTTEEAIGDDIKITKTNTNSSLSLNGVVTAYWVSIPITKLDTQNLAEVDHYHLLDVTFPNGKQYPACKGVVTTEKLMG
jgi:hypothetical protein